MISLMPQIEQVSIDTQYQWDFPLNTTKPANRALTSVWYVGLPLTSAHRGSHSGGGALLDQVAGQEHYLNEGTVYPHAALVEMITYHQRCFPTLAWRYLDLSHQTWETVRASIQDHPPDIVAYSVYTATYWWALIVAAEIKRVNPRAVVIFGNDHASLLYRDILQGTYGHELVDFIGLGNNGPFTMMGLLYALQGQLALERVPSIAYRQHGRVVVQAAPTYPLNRRYLPDYRLLAGEVQDSYDQAFTTWYAHHYTLPRMVTLPLDSGCQWGMHPKRRCKHCAIQGLTPKMAAVEQIIPTLETVVGELQANVYAAGDSTLGFSQQQWDGSFDFLDQLAAACARSPILHSQRFMLAYGLVAEFMQAAHLCQGFVRTWNVGIESFDPQLLKNDSKGINHGPEAILRAFELARSLDYRVYVSGIIGLPGTTLPQLHQEVQNWLALAETYQDILTTVSVALPALIPGSRMYYEAYQESATVRDWHGEYIPCRKLTERYIDQHTAVTMADVEAAVTEIGQGVLTIAQNGHNPIKFGGYMYGGVDETEHTEQTLLDSIMVHLR